VVVLAASAIESARLLLLSTSTHHPHGLGNGSGLVGRNLTFSTFGKATAIFSRATLRERLGETDMDLPFLQRSVQDDYWMPRSGLALPKGGTYNFILHHPNRINATMRLIMESDWTLSGAALKERMRRYFHDELWMEVEIFGEFLPTTDTYVDLDGEVRDAQGLPVARISVVHHPADVAVSRYMTERSVEMLSALRPAADKVWKYAEGGTTFHLQHGTCRFGRDPARSVLDPSCRAHEVENLYVTDGSFMPTSGGVPATPTIIANSLRVADILRERFARREIAG
ncbi:MAG: GMC oxidoreductase, partial [Myxococcota bacterium]